MDVEGAKREVIELLIKNHLLGIDVSDRVRGMLDDAAKDSDGICGEYSKGGVVVSYRLTLDVSIDRPLCSICRGFGGEGTRVCLRCNDSGFEPLPERD